MIYLILSILLAAGSWVLTTLFFDSVWAGLLPFMIVLPLSLYLFNKRVSKKFAVITERAQNAMSSINAMKSEKARETLMAKTIDILKEGYAYKNYQFFLKAQLDAQIGMIYYVQKKFKEAEPYLATAFFQQGIAIAMYACIHYKRKNFADMKKAFERAVKHSKKLPLVWNLYAWCLLQNKERDAAIVVLNRALAENAGDPTIASNLDLLKNSGKIKMRGYGEQWYQFHLEAPPQQKIVTYDKRSMYRGR